MKKIHLLVIKSFAGPFLITFVISMFVLVMQFLWLWIDELVGKGLGWAVISELLINQSTTLIPLALPISILLSSIMTFGNLGQHYELVAMKSAGIRLRNIMAPLIFFSFLLSLIAFYVANVVVPDSVLRSRTLLFDVQQKKPTFNLKEGLFYNGIQNFSIKVAEKDKSGRNLKDIVIYDHSSNEGHTGLILAENGIMEMSHDSSYLFFTLLNGVRYEELTGKGGRNTMPFERTRFKKQEIVLDLTDFKLSRSNADLFKNNYQMLNIQELNIEQDSLQMLMNNLGESLLTGLSPNFHIHSITPLTDTPNYKLLTKPFILDNFPPVDRKKIISMALSHARSIKNLTNFKISEQEAHMDYIRKIKMEWHRKFTLSVACLLFFFIGAPFGSIIRKGGLGMPMVSAICIFVIYYMLMVSGEKFAKEGVLPAWTGTWMSTLVLLPVAIFLTYKSGNDSVIFNSDFYLKVWDWLKNKYKKLYGKRSPSV